MAWWHRLIFGAGVVVVALVLARFADRAVNRRCGVSPEIVTRYRVLRRSITATIVAIGVLTALLVVPQVRAVAGGILASSAVVGIVVGFAARTTLANFVAGILIAFNQPIRIGDDVEVLGDRGTVTEVGLGYTTITTARGDRLLIPNEKLASEAIRNATIGSPRHLAELVIAVPATADLGHVCSALSEEVELSELALRDPPPQVRVTELEVDRASVCAQVWTQGSRQAADLEADVLQRVHRRLLAAGVYPGGTACA